MFHYNTASTEHVLYSCKHRNRSSNFYLNCLMQPRIKAKGLIETLEHYYETIAKQ